MFSSLYPSHVAAINPACVAERFLRVPQCLAGLSHCFTKHHQFRHLMWVGCGCRAGRTEHCISHAQQLKWSCVLLTAEPGGEVEVNEALYRQIVALTGQCMTERQCMI